MEEWTGWESWTEAEKHLRFGNFEEQAQAVVTLSKQLGHVEYKGIRDEWGALKMDTIQIIDMEEDLGPTADRVKRFNASWYPESPLWLILNAALFLLALPVLVLYLDGRGVLPQGEIWQKLLELSAFAQPLMEKSMWYLFFGALIGAILWFFVSPVHESGGGSAVYTAGLLMAMAAPVVGLIYGFFRRENTLAQAAWVPFLLVIALCVMCFVTVLFDLQRCVTGRLTCVKKKAYEQEEKDLKEHLEQCKKGVQEAKKYYQEDVNCLVFLKKQCAVDENTFLVALVAVKKYYEDLSKKLQNI
jgi:hypothetical protein